MRQELQEGKEKGLAWVAALGIERKGQTGTREGRKDWVTVKWRRKEWARRGMARRWGFWCRK